MKPLTFSGVETILKAGGFRLVSSRGSHFKWMHADGRWTVVPHHGSHPLPQGTLLSIFAQAGLPKPRR